MSKLAILASVFALAVGTVGCGNSQGQSNSLVDVGPSVLNSASPDGSVGTLTTLAKGGNKGGGGATGGSGGGGTTTTYTGSLSLVMLVDLNSNGAPNHGDTITFNVTSTATQPRVRVDCYQGSTLVYSKSVGYFDAYPWPQQFTLTSSNGWPNGGAATCTATLYTTTDGTTLNTITTLNFDVGA